MSEENSNIDQSGSVEPSFVNLDGTYGDMSKASEGVRDFVSKKGFKSIDEQTAAHVELEGMLGQQDKLIAIPEEGDVEGWNKVYDKFGRPESAEKYVFTARDGDPKPESSLITLFKEYAYKEGYSQEGFQKIIHFQMDAIKAADQVYAQEILEERNISQKAIRGRFDTEDDYNEFTQKGMAFAEKFKLDENKSVMDVLETKGLVHDPVILDMLGQLSDMTAEDSLPKSGGSLSATREDRIREIQKDPAFTTAMNPNHKKIMEEFMELHKPQQEREG